MEGTKHAKVIENALNKKESATSPLLIGQKGKPSTLSKGVSRNQGNLYQWLNTNKFKKTIAKPKCNVPIL
jgi:hypothetical protein